MAGAGVLSVTTARYAGHLVIRVTDTGCGIRSEDVGKLGTPFYTTKAEGTGLGLSVTYSIIQDHGGKIEVDSELGKGTTFSVYLPA
jgi:two-component system, sporulation sensor kinase E